MSDAGRGLSSRRLFHASILFSDLHNLMQIATFVGVMAIKRYRFKLRPTSIIFGMLPAIISLLAVTACNHDNGSRPDDNETTMRSLFQEGKSASMKGDFKKSDSIGAVLLHLADLADNDEYRARALICLSYSRIEMRDSTKQMKYLLQAEKMLANISNDTLAAELYNIMGVASFHDFDRAKEYFAKSLYASRKIGSVQHQMMAECNLAEIYRCIGDTLGIQYDLDIHDFATRTGNEVMRHAAAVRCAEYYMKRPQTLKESVKYINEIKAMSGKEFHYHYLMSKWLMATDSLDQAMEEWHEALKTGVITPGFLLTGGRLYQHHGDFGKSESYLTGADSAYSDIDSLNTDRIEIMRLRSTNLRHLGRTAEALEMLEDYQTARDSVSKITNTREMNAFKVKFETEKKELLIASQRTSLLWRNILLCMAIVFIVAIITGFMLYIRRRNRLYRLIVEQQKEFATRQNEYAPYLTERSPADKTRDTERANESDTAKLADMAAEETEEEDSTDKESEGGSLQRLPGRGKADAIWRDILAEMEKNRIYADPDVTRDMFAARVHTNHTWLTAIIKHRTGKSYTQFMNSWRINEALKILSRPEATMTNRELSEYLGFMTPQSFYTAFRQQMGMSPSRFRSDTLAASTPQEEESV